jgi:hypothetical protein
LHKVNELNNVENKDDFVGDSRYHRAPSCPEKRGGYQSKRRDVSTHNVESEIDNNQPGQDLGQSGKRKQEQQNEEDDVHTRYRSHRVAIGVEKVVGWMRTTWGSKKIALRPCPRVGDARSERVRGHWKSEL